MKLKSEAGLGSPVCNQKHRDPTVTCPVNVILWVLVSEVPPPTLRRSVSHFSMACWSSGVRWVWTGGLLVSGQGAGGGLSWMDDHSWDSCKKQEVTLEKEKAKGLRGCVLPQRCVTFAFWASKARSLRRRPAAADRLSVWSDNIRSTRPETCCCRRSRSSESAAAAASSWAFTSCTSSRSRSFT